ncbi:hypothetical protein [Shewanella sp. MF08487]|uniref:hypothetical protein n=1 Tax=Shewanella sp. MF08487 TaxID=3434873 RepID=UPI003D7BAD3B
MNNLEHSSTVTADFWSGFSSSKPKTFPIESEVIDFSFHRQISSTEIPNSIKQTTEIISPVDLDTNNIIAKSTNSYVRVSDKVQVLQKWEGVVLSIDHVNEEFTAQLIDKTSPINPDEIVVMSTEEISISDTCLLKEGAIFYWSIGYLFRGSTKSKNSAIHFSRLKGFTSKEIELAKEQGSHLEALFRGNK